MSGNESRLALFKEIWANWTTWSCIDFFALFQNRFERNVANSWCDIWHSTFTPMSPNEMINFNCRKSSKYKLHVGDIIEWACQVEQKIQNKVLVGQLCCRILPTWNININGHKIPRAIMMPFCRHGWEWRPGSKVHGANMGPTWVLSAPDGPHVGPMNLAIRAVISALDPDCTLDSCMIYRAGNLYCTTKFL